MLSFNLGSEDFFSPACSDIFLNCTLVEGILKIARYGNECGWCKPKEVFDVVDQYSCVVFLEVRKYIECFFVF